MIDKPKCPPCYGDCRQGRACDAEPDDEFDEELRPLEKVQVGCALIFSACVTAGVIVLLLRGCSA